MGWDFLRIGIFHFGLEKSPWMSIGDLESPNFYPRDWRFFKISGYLSPGIGDFVKSWDFYPGDWGFLSPGIGNFWKSGDFYTRGLRIFENLGIFIPGDWEFLKIWGFLYVRNPRDFLGMRIFSWDWISHQKATSYCQ